MNASAQRSLTIRKFLFAATLALICLSIILGLLHKTPWVVPEAEKQRKNPIAHSEAALKAAKVSYLDQCVQCHGETGKGDGSDAMMYDPAPANLTDAQHVNALTDGEIFYQITQGRKPMPSFKKRLTEQQRWELVLLVRSFAVLLSSPPAPEKEPYVPANKPSATGHH